MKKDVLHTIQDNMGSFSKASETDLDAALDLLGASSVGTIYLVDSYGSLYPENASALARTGYLKPRKRGCDSGYRYDACRIGICRNRYFRRLCYESVGRYVLYAAGRLWRDECIRVCKAALGRYRRGYPGCGCLRSV